MPMFAISQYICSSRCTLRLFRSLCGSSMLGASAYTVLSCSRSSSYFTLFPKFSRPLSTEPTPNPPRQDGGLPPGYNSAKHHNVPHTSTQTSNSSNSSIVGSWKDSDWEENPDFSISSFAELPTRDFGSNQHMIINQEFKEALRQILWQFRAPIRYAFAYGSGVFPQSGTATGESCHPAAPPTIQRMQQGGGKMIDFIFGVSYSQHWHSLNLNQHRDHYSAIGSLGSYVVSQVQDKWGAGVYFNPYVTVNGTLIKYGVVNIDTMCKDLSEWDTLYIAGRLHKPVKILRDHPRVRLANQMNLLSAVRVALLLLPPDFTESQLYTTIAEFNKMMEQATDEDPERIHRRQGTAFDRRIAAEDHLKEEVAKSIKKTISWPSTSQSIKGIVTAGFRRMFRYLKEKRDKYSKSKASSSTDHDDSTNKSKPD
ncbi:hypothetical protein CISG_00292 [Coccidioides immitis RMSCC 3703]|uniref:Phosphatidate cytidylyltransferase, mitochondrial n=1 Tax=Coccidioides immitis RMSCC 3703 TaxID=454286 RepID=A0A0J8QL91_COCIT|nr:hypothetical protein CISG_00292 [Coccidioides immitis RMSCC 3703]